MRLEFIMMGSLKFSVSRKMMCDDHISRCVMYPASLANLFHVPTSYVASFEFTHIKMCLKETYDTNATSEHNIVEAIKRGIVAYLLLDTVEYVQDNGKGSLKFHSDGEILVTKGWSNSIPLSDTRPREIIIDYASRLL